MRYAFINQDGIIVQVMFGDLNDADRVQFLRDYKILFGAVDSVRVEDDAPVWMGGSYDSNSGTFVPPPSPEPEVAPEEPTI